MPSETIEPQQQSTTSVATPPRPTRAHVLIQFVKFGIVGVSNTTLTFVVDEYLSVPATAIDATTISVDITAANTELVLKHAAEYSLFYTIGTDRILLKRGLLAVVDDTVAPAPAPAP